MQHPAKKVFRQPPTPPGRAEPPPQIASQLVAEEPKKAERVWKQWIERQPEGGSRLEDIEARARAATADWHPQKPISRESVIFFYKAREDVLTLAAALREALKHVDPGGVAGPE